jgi:lipopolysaccharide export system permease protein
MSTRFILDRYVVREVLVPFLLGLFALNSLFLINQLVRLSELFVGRGLTLEALGRLVGVLLPPFLLATLPAACLLAGIVAFARMSADSEFIALRSCGVSFLRMMWPVALFSGAVAAGALALGIATEPWGQGKLKEVALKTLEEHAGAALTPGSFNDLFGDVVVYVENAGRGGELDNIFISDERDPEQPLLVTARSGQLVRTPEEGFLGLRLQGGEIYRAGPIGAPVFRVRFDEYDLKLRVRSESGPAFTSMAQIRREVARRKAAGEPVERILRLWLDRSKNETLAIACLIFGVLGPALGLTAVRSGRMGGFAVGVVLVVAYYAVTTMTGALAVTGRMPVTAAAWTPNALFTLITLWVLWRAQRDRPLIPRPRPRVRAAAAPERA